MKLTESDARVLLTEGLLSADLEDHEEAIENYDKALKIVEFAEIYLNKGISLSELERFEEAATLEPNDSLIWYNKGVVLTDLERFDDAIINYEKAIDIKSDYADAWYNKAELLKHQGLEDEAQNCFNKVKEIEGN